MVKLDKRNQIKLNCGHILNSNEMGSKTNAKVLCVAVSILGFL